MKYKKFIDDAISCAAKSVNYVNNLDVPRKKIATQVLFFGSTANTDFLFESQLTAGQLCEFKNILHNLQDKVKLPPISSFLHLQKQIDRIRVDTPSVKDIIEIDVDKGYAQPEVSNGNAAVEVIDLCEDEGSQSGFIDLNKVNLKAVDVKHSSQNVPTSEKLNKEMEKFMTEMYPNKEVDTNHGYSVQFPSDQSNSSVELLETESNVKIEEVTECDEMEKTEKVVEDRSPKSKVMENENGQSEADTSTDENNSSFQYSADSENSGKFNS